jgi:hypothetical protein
MGAALTYARRYGLFTLVGIAGEDDLDAPDLEGTSKPDPEAPNASAGHGSNGHTAPVLNGRRRNPAVAVAAPILAPDQSAQQRDRLLSELAILETSDAAAAWAHQSLPAKNTLTDADAKMVEMHFQTRLEAFDDGQPEALAKLAQTKPEEDKAVQPKSGVSVQPATHANGAGIVRAVSRPRPSGCATRPIANTCPGSRAWCAVERPPTPTICALRNREPWGARSAMSLLFQCVGPIIGSCTGTVMRLPGGKASSLIRCRLRVGYGSASDSARLPMETHTLPL